MTRGKASNRWCLTDLESDVGEPIDPELKKYQVRGFPSGMRWRSSSWFPPLHEEETIFNSVSLALGEQVLLPPLLPYVVAHILKALFFDIMHACLRNFEDSSCIALKQYPFVRSDLVVFAFRARTEDTFRHLGSPKLWVKHAWAGPGPNFLKSSGELGPGSLCSRWCVTVSPFAGLAFL